MLDIKFIRENTDQVKQAAKNKNKEVDIDLLLKLDVERKDLLNEVEEMRKERNELAASLKKGKPTSEQIEKGKKIKVDLAQKSEKYEWVDAKYKEILLAVPNVTSPDMPVGADEDDNVVVHKYGEIPKFDFEPKDHVELGKELDLIDVDKSGNISGPRSYYIKNELALIQYALVQMVFHTLTDAKIIKELADKVGNPSAKTFSPILPPLFIKPEVMKKMDRLDPIDDRYEMKIDDLVLIGSAEHTLGPLHMDEVINKESLPIRYLGYSAAFRRESGSYGRDTKGILRVHHFDKMEMESFTDKESGAVEQKLIVAIQEYIVQQLELPYQLVHICTGDTGKPDYDQYDIECWIPTQNKYRETHTSDYMTDYQARRLQTRYVDEEGNKQYVHMNDATAFANTRLLIAIMENNQQADGSIVIPEVLRKWMPGGQEIITKK